jgi:hypothetical protein
MAEIVDGGFYVPEDDDQQRLAALRDDPTSYMGFFPVGRECKNVLRARGVVVSRTKDWEQS